VANREVNLTKKGLNAARDAVLSRCAVREWTCQPDIVREWKERRSPRRAYYVERREGHARR
jgi:hypothetical protein